MNKFVIRLGSVNDVALFCATCRKYGSDIVYMIAGNKVDAKSILEIMCIGIRKDAEVCICSKDKEICQKFKEDIQLWIKY